MFMRTPTPVTGGRRRVVFLIGLILLAIYLVASTAAGLWTDYLWFDSVGYAPVWWSRLWTRVGLLVVGVGLSFFFLFSNLALVDRMSLRYLSPATSDQEEFLARLREWVDPRLRTLRLVGSAVLAVMVGGSAATWIDRLYLFFNPQNFGRADPLFNHDVGFYVFQLPFINDLLVWGFNIFLLTTLVAAAAHYVNGALRLRRGAAFFSGGAKVHLSLLLAGLALLRAGLYQVDAYRLLYSNRAEEFFGPGYTERFARLPAIRLLMAVAVLTAVALVINIWRKGWTLPVVAAAAWALVAVGAGLIYPAVVERFQVNPNVVRQYDFIVNNIAFTRAAYGLEAVEVRDFAADPVIEPEEIEAQQAALDNLRLWDSFVLSRAYSPQEFRNYYDLSRVDTDRYMLGDSPTQIMLSVRELDVSVVDDSWQNRRLSYTHGFGVVASHAAQLGVDGQPLYLISEIPPVSTVDSLEIAEPRIYFGEIVAEEPVIVRNQTGEIDFPQGQESAALSDYAGTGGVEMSNIWRRAAMALRYRDLNIVLSDQIEPDSRILMERNIRDIVQKLAPFLEVDSDPYPVIVDGGVKWVVDLYTSSPNYPFSTPLTAAEMLRLQRSSGIKVGTNYIRNSVKAVIDAYQGTVIFYAADDFDPVLKAWREAFPSLVQPTGAMPAEIRRHTRYPMDLFTIQSELYREYYIQDPATFFSARDAWDIPQRPIDSGDGQTDRRRELLRGDVRTPQSNAVTYLDQVLPYYLLMPMEGRLTYVGLQSFTPRDRANLSSFLVVASDPDNFGELVEFRMPPGSTVAGIEQVAARIESDPDIAAQFTLWRNRGSRAIQGDIMIIPIGESLVYIQPVYLEAEATSLPEFERVIVVYGERIEWGSSLQSTIDLVFGGSGDPNEPEPPGTGDAAALLAAAADAFEQADLALRSGDLARYQQLVDQARSLVEQARELLGSTEASRRAIAS
jgi:hypothetical protein